MAKYNRDDGSNSDSSSGSIKEITADDFKDGSRGADSRSRVWVDNYRRYNPVQRRNYQDLYSFAWSQAVQNKPLGIDIKKDEVEDEDDIEMLIEENASDGEKEEGEIEEGEIELGTENVTVLSVGNEETRVEKSEGKVEIDLETDVKVEEIDEFDKKFGLVLEELETITEEEAESSFEDVCTRLQKCFAGLKQMFAEGHGPALDVLAQQAFMGIQTLYSAFSSGTLKKMDQNKELLLRLLIHIKNQYSVCLTPEQVKEIDVRVHSLASEAVCLGKSMVNVNSSAHVAEKHVISTEKPKADPRLRSYGGINNSGKTSVPQVDLPTNSRTSRFNLNPLLNLHEDYDEDSLPSPTRNNAPPLPVLKPIGFGSRPSPTPAPAQMLTMAAKKVKENGSKLHPYVTDAFKAVSSYQQKYVKNSSAVFNQLPSPTPSEDGNEDDDDTSEVSSVATNRIVGPTSPAIYTNIYSGISQMVPVKPIGNNGLEPKPVVKVSAKSRDPRLRFMNSELSSNISQNGNSRKHKTVDDPVPEEPNLKRQRNGSIDPRDGQASIGGGGWIEDNGMIAPQTNNKVQSDKNFNGFNVSNNFNGSNGGSSVPSVSSSTAPVVSLPSLLKDIAVNPTMLVQFVKEQQRLATDGQQKGAAPAINGLSNVLSSTSESGKNLSLKPQLPIEPSPVNAQNEPGKIRMKPRDPRRILHSNVVQKSENSVSEPIKTSVLASQSNKDNLTIREQGEQAQSISLPSLSTSPPDTLRQVSENLNNLADMVSSSPASSLSQSASLPIASKISNDPTESKTPSSRGGTTDAANSWGDMDHLLDGYDEQQKVAIQKERARRIAEQNKMFAARKLCLVLDLDHTLLNSAKFGEIDQAHEEILRMKEEQDKQKPERHLYRFPHMGMWTKLRPGVWNFLEKASQLFEMHLYTMGNKLYATEMAKILDPQGTLFSGRVISRGDDDDNIDGDDRVPKSKDLDGVLGMESAVVIIDDSVRVWPHNKLNLIAVERYTYFPSSRRQFGLLGPSLLEVDHDERPEAGTLASSLEVIKRIHRNFFSHQNLNEVDVRNILAAEQRKILAGCKIVFSRVFPVGEANPHLHPLWQTAEQFGAECTNQIDEHVTHVVANSMGTDKVNWALSTGRFVVNPGWVEASALLYRRANEQDFAIKI